MKTAVECSRCKKNGYRILIVVNPYVDSITKVTKNRIFNYWSGTRHWHLDLLDRGNDFD